MKGTGTQTSVTNLCWLFGRHRQSYYEFLAAMDILAIQHALIIKEVNRIRIDHPVMGGRKLHALLDDFRMQLKLKMGRDAFFDLLYEHRLLVRRRRSGVRTTNSAHWFKKYKNLIKEVTPKGINHIWVSDITYWRIDTGFVYISLITDA